MTDSEPDELPNSVCGYQNGSETMTIKGPNFSRSFQKNTFTSNMNIPWNLDRPRYAQSAYDQRSIYSRRETSPMSLHSVSSRQPQNFCNSYMNAGLYRDHRRPYIERSGSPMSVRTMDSTVSAIDVAAILKNQKFNKHEWRIIKEAINKNMKNRFKGVEKRRKLRMFRTRRNSGYDSREPRSDSSISSDDCRSTRTCRTAYNENTFSCRSTKTDVTDFRRTMTETSMYRDCTEKFRQNSFKNMIQIGPRSANENTLKPQNILGTSNISRQDRFRHDLLPSQRFNQSGALVAIPEKENILHRSIVEKNMFNTKGNGMNQNKRPELHNIHEADSDDEEIFSVTSVNKTTFNDSSTQPKRSLDVDDAICIAKNKRPKLSPPQNKKPASELSVPSKTNISNQKNANDFQFVKPQFPVKKLTSVRKNISKPQQSTQKFTSKSVQETSERLISKMSSQPLDALHKQAVQPLPHCDAQEKVQGEELHHLSTTDVSMRPSFIKRKLFTQKIDDAEIKNSSFDNPAESPPSNIYSAIQKEKNKTRKLVTTQSCLSRDVVGDDSNLLDLIHKIVPKDRMNATTAVNKSIITKNNKPADNTNKWDVSSVISKCNEDDVSDTYTDEEIFQVDEHSVTTTKKMNCKEDVQIITKTKKTSEMAKTMPQQNVKKCEVVLKKLPNKTNSATNVTIKANIENKVNSPIGDNGLKNQNVYDRIKSFWDTDFESDMENEGAFRLNSNFKINQSKGTQNNVDNQHSKKYDTSNIKLTSEITVLPNSKANLTKTVEKVSVNNNSRKITAPAASNVSPAASNDSPAEEIKPSTSGKAKKKITPAAAKVKPLEQNKSTPVKTKKKTIPEVAPLEQNMMSVKTKKTRVAPKVPPSEQNKPCMSVTRKKGTKPESPQVSPPDLKMKPSKSVKIKNKEDAMSSKKNDVTSIVKTNNKTASDNNNLKNKENSIKATNNKNTLKVRPHDKELLKPEQSLNETNETLNKSLRSRTIYLSTSSVSDKTSTFEKTPAKNKGRLCKNKNVTMDKSRSGISFSLTDKSPTRKTNKRVSALTKNDTRMKTRASDVSFTLTVKNSKNISAKELKSLQSTSFFLRSSDNSFKRSRKKCCW